MTIRKIESRAAQNKKRVAAYARVSTETCEQLESLDAQIAYYTNLISENSNWEYAGVYADPGRSGTNARRRPAFQEMIQTALSGGLDVILVKSISRFARNAADAQAYVHELKSHEVEVRFEREGISSFDPASDMVFSVLAAVAQEESRSVSENVKWSYRKHAEKGVRHIGSNRVLGYDEINGVLTPNKDSWIVKRIFADYANLVSPGLIAQNLNAAGARRLRSDKPFTPDAIGKTLDNEIYVGDRLIQKKPPRDFLTKLPDPTSSYFHAYITDDHEPIIDRETWNRVREIRARRQKERALGLKPNKNSHPLYGAVFCAHCGAPFKRRMIKTRDGGSHKTWLCAAKQNDAACSAPMIRESALLKAISDRIGLAWTDESHFDIKAYRQTITRVEVGENGVEVQLDIR